jgi:photosystem II stability/assembly factor-like uncharacterized protein
MAYDVYWGYLQHWNGTTWTNVLPSFLEDVKMRTTDDGWAVGINDTILRWNGSAWNPVSSPETNKYLQAVSILSANDAWIVGQNGSGTAIILHWDGTQWNSVPSPVPALDARSDVQMLVD